MADLFDKNNLVKTLIRAAWLSILLGLGVEVLLLLAAAFFQQTSSTAAIIAETVHKISWSTLVCSGIAVGIAATKMRPPIMGLAGLIAAPAAFYIAKIAHKSVIQALSITGPAAAAAPSPLLLAGIKGLEYATLGFLIGLLGTRTDLKLRGHLLAGAAVGLVFGGSIVALMVTMAEKPIPPVGIVTRCINEVIFPVGCALVLYAAQKLGSKKEMERPEDELMENPASGARGE